MTVFLTRLIETALFPPAGPMILVLAGTLLLFFGARRFGRMLVALGFVALYFATIPFTAFALADYLERTPPLDAQALTLTPARAIVVLGGGRGEAPEYGGLTVTTAALERLRYAATLRRKSGLPLLVSGGDPLGEGESEAAVMKKVLEEEFGVPVEWSEGRSRTTRENARDSWEILDGHGIERIVLVTHAWHMPRAQRSFEEQGFTVTPAPTAYLTRGPMTEGPLLWLPTAWAMKQIDRYLHEVVGMVWYRYFR